MKLIHSATIFIWKISLYLLWIFCLETSKNLLTVDLFVILAGWALLEGRRRFIFASRCYPKRRGVKNKAIERKSERQHPNIVRTCVISLERFQNVYRTYKFHFIAISRRPIASQIIKYNHFCIAAPIILLSNEITNCPIYYFSFIITARSPFAKPIAIYRSS